jgi:hypothetical protein
VDFVVMPLSCSEVESRRDEYRKFRWQVDERPPVTHNDVTTGTKLTHWGLPNQSPFIFLGLDESGKVLACLEDGYVVRFGSDSWFAVVEEGQQRQDLCGKALAQVQLAYAENKKLWSA